MAADPTIAGLNIVLRTLVRGALIDLNELKKEGLEPLAFRAMMRVVIDIIGGAAADTMERPVDREAIVAVFDEELAKLREAPRSRPTKE